MAAALPSSSPSTPAAPATTLIILGADAVLAALPATPVQLAHACERLGYDAVVPASWGDELVAAACLEALAQRDDDHTSPAGPLLLCACPHVTRRMLQLGPELRDFLLPLVAPPVALARYLRAAHAPRTLHLTYAGRCPAAGAELDVQLSPDELLGLVAAAGIVVGEMPTEYEDVLPPDRRRYFSQPGGAPAAFAVAALGGWELVELHDDELTLGLAQQLLRESPALIDAAPRLGCSCSGMTGFSAATARARVTALEPPRAGAPVVDRAVSIPMTFALPESTRTTPPTLGPGAVGRPTPPAGMARAPVDHAPPHRSPTSTRAIVGPTPVARKPEGRPLPRAYVARRRLSPRPGHVGQIPPAPRDAAAPPPAPEPEAPGTPRALYGGHSGPLGRLTREDQEHLARETRRTQEARPADAGAEPPAPPAVVPGSNGAASPQTTLALLAFLESIDDVASASQASADTQLRGRAGELAQRTERLLAALGFSEIPSLGREASEGEHEIVRTVPRAPGQARREIVEVVQRGFRYAGQVIRRAQVVVAD